MGELAEVDDRCKVERLEGLFGHRVKKVKEVDEAIRVYGCTDSFESRRRRFSWC